MDVRKTVRCGATIAFRPTRLPARAGSIPAALQPASRVFRRSQVEIDIGQQDRPATASTLNKARRRPPLPGDS